MMIIQFCFCKALKTNKYQNYWQISWFGNNLMDETDTAEVLTNDVTGALVFHSCLEDWNGDRLLHQVSCIRCHVFIAIISHFGPEVWQLLPFSWTCLNMQVLDQSLYCNPGKRLYSTRYLRRGTMITCVWFRFSFWLFKDGEQERNLNWAWKIIKDQVLRWNRL